jgi:hypothetical protein
VVKEFLDDISRAVGSSLLWNDEAFVLGVGNEEYSCAEGDNAAADTKTLHDQLVLFYQPSGNE